jgi:hypothetical protein
MRDETIRTKALNYSRLHLKEIVAYLITAASVTITASMAYGHKQAGDEMTAKDFQDLKNEVQRMHGELTEVKESQARVEGTVAAIIPWAQGAAKFQAAVQQGAAEALATPIPKTGHRAKH